MTNRRIAAPRVTVPLCPLGPLLARRSLPEFKTTGRSRESTPVHFAATPLRRLEFRLLLSAICYLLFAKRALRSPSHRLIFPQPLAPHHLRCCRRHDNPKRLYTEPEPQIGSMYPVH